MSSRIAASAALPERPNLEHLRGQARRRLRELRQRSATARLTEAQLQIAREYGFASWRELKAAIERQGAPTARFSNLTGFYRHDPYLVANSVVRVLAEGGRLLIERAGSSRLPLSDRGQGRFAIAGVEGWYTFEGADDGPATALVNRTNAGEARLQRIGAAEARAIGVARDQARAEQNRPRLATDVPLDILQRYVGHYASSQGLALEVACRDGALRVQVAGEPQFEIFPESESDFFYRIIPARLSFAVDDGRAVDAILHHNGIRRRLDRVSAEVAERAASQIQAKLADQERPRTLAAIDPGVLPRYVGRYRLDAACALIVSTEDGRLLIEIPGQRRHEVYPESENVFFWTVVAAQISFVTDSAGRLTHAVLHQHGRDVPLTRMDDEGAAT